MVLREGEAGDACYLIAAGKVRVTKAGVQVAELGPGSFFGEFAVLSDQRRHASVQAIEPLELLEIRRELIDELVAAHPGVARTLRTFYRERLLQTLLATAPFFQRLSAEERAPSPSASGRGASGAARRSSRRARPAAGSTSSSSARSTSCARARPRTEATPRQAGHARRGQLLRRDVAPARRRRVGDGARRRA